jgi:hypothetical protein
MFSLHEDLKEGSGSGDVEDKEKIKPRKRGWEAFDRQSPPFANGVKDGAPSRSIDPLVKLKRREAVY